tara:strand:+ start:557 stop:1822 length:1266 start_codon:yes stop_codon:yes gene_type:complete
MYGLQILDEEGVLLSNLARKDNAHIEALLGSLNQEYQLIHHTLKPQKNKKIISFSLYGDKEIYSSGAETNIDEAEKIYPDWTCRIYCTEGAPNLQKLINDNRCEVVVLKSNIFPMYWRFFAIDDPTVDIVCIRDSDSVVSEKEALAVKNWEQCEKTFHTMHDADNPSAHMKIVMGGMWGIKCNRKINITNMLNLYTRAHDYKWHYGQDQEFLEKILFLLFKKDCIDHTSHQKIRWEHSVPFPEGGNLKYGGFVGDRVNPVQSRQLDLNTFSKDSNKAYLFSHQAFEDFIICNGLIRALAEKYEEIILPIKQENFSVVSYMFRDVKNIKSISIIDDNNAFNIYLESHKKSHRFIGLGLWNQDPSSFDASNVEESFYNQFSVEPLERFRKFYVDLADAEQKISKKELKKILIFKDVIKKKEQE